MRWFFTILCLLFFNVNAVYAIDLHIYPQGNHGAQSCIDHENAALENALKNKNKFLLLEGFHFDKNTGMTLDSIVDKQGYKENLLNELRLRVSQNNQPNIFGSETKEFENVHGIIADISLVVFYYDLFTHSPPHSTGTNGQIAMKRMIKGAFRTTYFLPRSIYENLKNIYSDKDYNLSYYYLKYYDLYEKHVDENQNITDANEFIHDIHKDIPGLLKIASRAFDVLSDDMQDFILRIPARLQIAEMKRYHADVRSRLGYFYKDESQFDFDENYNFLEFRSFGGKLIAYRNLSYIDDLMSIEDKYQVKSIDFIVGKAHVPGLKELVEAGFANDQNGKPRINIVVHEECK